MVWPSRHHAAQASNPAALYRQWKWRVLLMFSGFSMFLRGHERGASLNTTGRGGQEEQRVGYSCGGWAAHALSAAWS